jgi:hypothetical protein
MKNGLLTFVCIFVCVGACSAQDTRRELNYDPAIVTITGVLVSRTYYGPPNYGENPKTDSKERQYVLILDSPVDVVGDQNDELNKTERGIKRVTLVVHDFKAHPVESLLGGRVEVQGKLFHAHTGHHHTKVLIDVTSIDKLKKT